MSFSRSWYAAGIAPLLSVVVLAGGAHAQSQDLGAYTLFAVHELRARRLEVALGDVGVNDGRLFVRMGDRLDAPESELSADEARIPETARCRRLVARDPGAAAPDCPSTTAFQPPFADTQAVGAACGFPAPFPACSPDAGRDVTVGPGTTRTLEPGTYGDLIVSASEFAHGTLVLRPGVYTFCSLLTARGADVVFEGPSTVHVSGGFKLGNGSALNPTGAQDVTVYADSGVLHLVRRSQMEAVVCAPRATAQLGPGVKTVGRLVAQRIVAAGLEATLYTTTTTSTSSSTSSSSSSSTSTSSSSSTSTTSSTTSSTSTSTTSSTTTSTSSTSSTSSSTSTTSSTTTTSTLPPPRCGDGIVNQASEQCDDGNAIDDDCCSAACASGPDGQACGGGLCGGDQTCRAGACVQTTADDLLACLVPFTTAIVTNFDDGTASPLDLQSGNVGEPVTVGRGAWGVAIHPGGDEIWVTARVDDRITVLDAATRTVRATIDAGSLPLGIVFDPTGTRAYVASFGNDRVLVMDVASRQVLSQVPVGNGPSGLALDPTGTRLYVSNYGGNSISVIDITTERVIATVKTKKRPLELALDAPRGRLYVTNFGANRVSVIGTISNSVLASIPVGKKPFGVAVNAAGRAFVTNGVSDTVSVIEGDECQVVDTIEVGQGPLGIGLDLTGSRALVANGNDSTLSILDTAAGTTIATIPVGTTPVAFGGFVGALGAACPRAPLVCDDVNPMTLDSCDAEAGCRFQPYDPTEAARIGLDTLDTIVREAGVEPLGGTTRAALLSRLSLAARDELVEGSGTLDRRIARADRNVRRFAKVVRKAIRRRKMSCGVGQDILDLSRGIHVQMRLARTRS